MNDGLSEIKSIDIRAEKQGAGKAAPSSSGVPRPVWKLSPNPNGSTLYDSFELQAVTKQLNKAIQGSNGPLSPYSCYLKSSPLYRQGLDRIYKEGAKTPRRITSRRVVDTASVDAWCPRRLVIRLWKKNQTRASVEQVERQYG